MEKWTDGQMRVKQQGRLLDKHMDSQKEEQADTLTDRLILILILFFDIAG
jgi:hypothetical protein